MRPKASLPAHGGPLEPRIKQITFDTINVLAMNVATQAALSLVPSRRTTAIMMDSRDCASHTVLSSGLRLKKSILFTEALPLQERMTKIVFETLATALMPSLVFTVLPHEGSEESHNERSYSLRTTVKCGSVRVVNEDLGGMSLAEVGLALKSHLLAPSSDPAASVVNFVLRHSGLERGGNIERHSPLSALVLPHSG